AETGFETEAMLYGVSGVAGICFSRFAKPNPRARTTLPSLSTATDIPGMCASVRSESSVAAKAARSGAGGALGVTWEGPVAQAARRAQRTAHPKILMFISLQAEAAAPRLRAAGMSPRHSARGRGRSPRAHSARHGEACCGG